MELPWRQSSNEIMGIHPLLIHIDILVVVRLRGVETQPESD